MHAESSGRAPPLISNPLTLDQVVATTPESAPRITDAEKLLVSFARDLSTCTADEIRERWGEQERAAIDKIDEVGFEGRLKDHNPIYYLATNCWFDNEPTLPYAPLHRDRICAELLRHYFDQSRDFAGFVLLVQRDSFKTTFTHGIFPMFVALREKHLNKRDARLALIHHKEMQASFNLQRLKAKTIQHPWFKKVWPEFSADAEHGTKTAFDWPCKTPAVFPEPSVVAAGLGARLVGFHFDWMIFDDIVTEEHILSKPIREEAFAKYQASRFMLDTNRGRELCSGTRYHINDLWRRLEKAKVDDKPLYRFLRIKAIEDDETLSFPTRHTYERLEQMRQEELSRAGNDQLWHLQMQNEPRTSGLIVADPAWFRWCSQKEIPFAAWRVITVDGAWKGTKNAGEGDYASIQCWGFERRGSLVLRYLMDGVHSNELTSLDGEREIFRLMQKYDVIDVAPEENGGFAFRTSLENSATTRGVPINIIELKSKQTQKQMREVAFLKEMQAGRVFICEEANGDLVEALRDQVLEFPQLDHDDAIDGAAYSCDPNVTEMYTPLWNTRELERRARPAAEAPRTRYCAL